MFALKIKILSSFFSAAKQIDLTQVSLASYEKISEQNRCEKGFWLNSRKNVQECMSDILLMEKCSTKFFSHSTKDGNCFCAKLGEKCELVPHGIVNTYKIKYPSK